MKTKKKSPKEELAISISYVYFFLSKIDIINKKQTLVEEKVGRWSFSSKGSVLHKKLLTKSSIDKFVDDTSLCLMSLL